MATAETIALLGAKPVFVDIEEDSYLIDHRLIEEKITAKTKPLFLFLFMAKYRIWMRLIKSLKNIHKNWVIRFMLLRTQRKSFGAEYKGKKSGNVSDIACSNFFPTKPLGCYGMVVLFLHLTIN